MEVWIITVIAVAACCFLCCCLPCMCNSCMSSSYRRKMKQEFESKSLLCETKYGTVEYSISKPSGDIAGYVLCMNGTPGFHDGYNRGFDALVEKGFCVVAPSRPNYGRTKLTNDWKKAQEAADGLAALMEELKIDSYAVFAASGGGPQTCHLALKYPDRVKCLILDGAITGGLRVEGTEKVQNNTHKMLVTSPSFPRGMHYFQRSKPLKYVEHILESMSSAPEEERKKQA